jgi:hypothetical protein
MPIHTVLGLAATGWLVAGWSGTAAADTARQGTDGDDDEQGESEEQQLREQPGPAPFLPCRFPS